MNFEGLVTSLAARKRIQPTALLVDLNIVDAVTFSHPSEYLISGSWSSIINEVLLYRDVDVVRKGEQGGV